MSRRPPRRPPRGTSVLLINEHPLQVLPSLAEAVGLNEAIILQQIHFWLGRSDHVFDGQTWIYNTYEEWEKQFPWWGLNTIKRAIYHLESLGILVSTARFNRNPIDKSKWYTINQARLNDFIGLTTTQNGSSTTQDELQDDPSRAEDDPSWVVSHRDPTETTTEIPLPQTPPPDGEGPDAIAVGNGSADAPETAGYPWERPAFPTSHQPWAKPVPPAIAACGLCDDHGLLDLDTADGTRLTAKCCHDPGAMQAFAAHHGYQLVRQDRSREPPALGKGGGSGERGREVGSRDEPVGGTPPTPPPPPSPPSPSPEGGPGG